MTDFNEKLQRIAELGTELMGIINTDLDLISADTACHAWTREPKELVMHVSSRNYDEITEAFRPTWKLRTIFEKGYHFEAEFNGIKLLMIFNDLDLPEELIDQVKTDIERKIRERKKAQPAATDKAEC